MSDATTVATVATEYPVTVAHKTEPRARDFLFWRPAVKADIANDPQNHSIHSYASCGYCGSCHPIELAAAIRAGYAAADLADWKYGWPHKAYANIAEVFVGEPEIKSSLYSKGVTTFAAPERAGATRYVKFYTEHLQDATPEDRETIERALGYHFKFEDGAVRWWPVKI